MSQPLLILTGVSGTGKDTVASELLKHGFTSAIPHTTRDMRENESEGNPYHFVSKDVYKEMLSNDEFIESNSYLTKFSGIEALAFYGLSKYSVVDTDTPTVLTVGIESSIETKKVIPSAILVCLEVSDDIRETRARERGSFDQIEWGNRLAQDVARRENGEHNLSVMDLTVDNTQPLEKSVSQILSYYKGS